MDQNSQLRELCRNFQGLPPKSSHKDHATAAPDTKYLDIASLPGANEKQQETTQRGTQTLLDERTLTPLPVSLL